MYISYFFIGFKHVFLDVLDTTTWSFSLRAVNVRNTKKIAEYVFICICLFDTMGSNLGDEYVCVKKCA